jgi:hypothetical protein
MPERSSGGPAHNGVECGELVTLRARLCYESRCDGYTAAPFGI